MTAEPPHGTTLITGASSGIGLELAKLLAAEGSDLVLVARRKEALDKIAAKLEEDHGVHAHVLAEDLSRAGTPQQLYDELGARGAKVDTVVNNAGFGALGHLEELGLQRQVDMIEVNVTALTKITRLFLPPMLDRGRGRILNVASTAAFQPGPHMAVYYATKAYVMSFSEALTEELSGTGVTVTCLAPGPTETPFRQASGMEDATLFRLGAMNAEAVARAGYRGLCRGKALVVPGLRNKLGVWSVRFLPRFLVRKVVKGLQPLD